MTRPVSTKPATAPDWARLRQRVEELGRAATGGGELSPAEAQAVLEARARALAAPAAAPRDHDALELVHFELAGERYAIEARYLIEATRLVELAVIPGAEPPVLGITGWRGGLLTLLDLRQVLGLAPSTEGRSDRLLVLGEGHAAFGVLVDAVQALDEVPVSEIRPLPGDARRGRGFLRGTTPGAVLVLSAVDLIRAHT